MTLDKWDQYILKQIANRPAGIRRKDLTGWGFQPYRVEQLARWGYLRTTTYVGIESFVITSRGRTLVGK